MAGYSNKPGWVPKAVWARIFRQGKRAGRIEAARKFGQNFKRRETARAGSKLWWKSPTGQAAARSEWDDWRTSNKPGTTWQRQRSAENMARAQSKGRRACGCPRASPCSC